jgi:hypothetical protein
MRPVPNRDANQRPQRFLNLNPLPQGQGSFLPAGPAMQNAFKLQMLHFRGWMIVIALGLVPLTFNELSKIFLRAHKNKIEHLFN